MGDGDGLFLAGGRGHVVDQGGRRLEQAEADGGRDGGSGQFGGRGYEDEFEILSVMWGGGRLGGLCSGACVGGLSAVDGSRPAYIQEVERRITRRYISRCFRAVAWTHIPRRLAGVHIVSNNYYCLIFKHRTSLKSRLNSE